jgi:hypothetical protein
MWMLCVSPVVSPSSERRNGTTFPSEYEELLPLRSPFCQLQGVVSLAHWSRLTDTEPAVALLTAELELELAPASPETVSTATTNRPNSPIRNASRRMPLPLIPR